MEFDESASIRLIGEMLGLAHVVGDCEQIKVLSVELLDTSLAVTVEAASEDPILLRGQAASVMGGLSGMDIPNLFPALRYDAFAVRLKSRTGSELMWVVSSPADAAFAETGAVRWLSNSIFQDSTPTYLRAQVDRIVGELEVGLRALLHVHCSEELGSGYSRSLFDPKVLKKLRKSARQEGQDDSDDRTLLDYTLLPQLADLVCSNAALAAHGCVVNEDLLRLDLMALNKIRRKVAHHRVVTSDEVAAAREIADRVLGAVGEHHPGLVKDFLTSRWDQAVGDIVVQLQAGMQVPEPPERGSIPEQARRAIARSMFLKQQAAASLAFDDAQRLTVPAIRSRVHGRLVSALGRLVASLAEGAELAGARSSSVEEARAHQLAHGVIMNELEELGSDTLQARLETTS